MKTINCAQDGRSHGLQTDTLRAIIPRIDPARKINLAKYDPLADYLARSDKERVSLTFDQIGELVGGLPPTAYEKNEWWANEDVRTTRHAQCKSWQRAGYQVSVDRCARIATFARTA